jgi:tetratricopeptide (TPR) repeat protein
MSCRDIAGEIERGLAFLTASSREVSERHRSIQAVFQHSWALLSEDEQRVLRRLAVFRGGFRREAAEHVAGASLTLLRSLIDKSLLRRSGASRYDMHELVRQYAELRLMEHPEDALAVQHRHTAYFVTFLQGQRTHLRGARLPEALSEMRAEIENVRVAWRQAVANDTLTALKESLQSLMDFYDIPGWSQEGEQTFQLAVERLSAAAGSIESLDPQRGTMIGQILAGQGWLALSAGYYQRTREILGRSLAILRRYDAREELMNPLHTLGVTAYIMGDYDQAQHLLQESAAAQHAVGDRWGEGWSIGVLGQVALARGAFADAHTMILQAFDHFRTLGDPRMLGLSYSFLSIATCALGNIADAQRLANEGLTLSREIVHPWGIAVSLCHLGIATALAGQYTKAQRLFEESLEIIKKTEEPWLSARVLVNLADTMAAQGMYTEAKPRALEALNVALEAQLIPQVLDALVAIATALVAENQAPLAAPLLVPARQHPASSIFTRMRATALLDQITPNLPPDMVADLHSQAISGDLSRLAKTVLVTYYARSV